MSNSTSENKGSKKDSARRVATPKRRFFFPESGVSVEAVDLQSAEKQLKNQTKEGDREK